MLGIIVRLSKEDESSNSIDNQIREGQDFAKTNNENYLLYNEGEGVSGGLPIEKRPIIQKLIDDIEKKIITKLWFRDQNRIERNSLTFHIIADVIRRNNVMVFFGDKKSIDFNDANQFFNSSIMSLVNAYQIHKQSNQTKKTLKDHAKEGKIHSVIAYGYSKDKDRVMIIDQEESEVVKRVYELSLSGMGGRSIAKILNDEGVETRYKKMGSRAYTRVHKHTGKKVVYNSENCLWTSKTVLNLIKSPVYKGERTFSGKLYKCPAIVTPAYWQKVNDNLKNNRNNSGKKVDHKYLLKGILECSYCGRNYYGNRRVNLRSANYYMCSGKRLREKPCTNRGINIDKLNDIIWMLFFEDENYKELVKEAIRDDFNNQSTSSIQKEIEAAKKGLKSLQAKKKRAIKLTIDGTLSDEDIKSELKLIKSQRIGFENKLIKYNEVVKKVQENKTLIKQMDHDFSKAHKDATFEEKRTIIHRYIDRIYINYIPQKKLYEIRVQTKTTTPLSELILVDWQYNIAFLLRNHKIIKINEKVKESRVYEIIGRMQNEIQLKIV